jgi:hypothetical protein
MTKFLIHPILLAAKIIRSMSPSQVEQRESERVLSCILYLSDANPLLRAVSAVFLKLCCQESPRGHLWHVSSVEVSLFPLIGVLTQLIIIKGRKLKCDGNRPSCSNCNRRNLPCQYNAMYVILFFTIDQNQPTIFSSAQR